jgi:hypothetical protein
MSANTDEQVIEDFLNIHGLAHCCNCGKLMFASDENSDSLEKAEDESDGSAWLVTDEGWFGIWGDPHIIGKDDVVFLYLCPECLKRMKEYLKIPEEAPKQ